MFTNKKPVLFATALVALLTAPITQAKQPASLNNCQALTQFVAQFYLYGSACERTYNSNIVAQIENHADQIYAYFTACQKLGMTQKMQDAWDERALYRYGAAIRKKYAISHQDTDNQYQQKIAVFCQDERTTMEKQMKRWFK